MKTKKVDYLLDFIRGPMILDVGCAAHYPEPDSEYWVHGRIRKKYPSYKVYGIDISETNINKLRQFGYDNIYLADAQSFEFKDLLFDTVFAGELIEHLQNPGLFLERAKKAIKDDGIIILTTPYPFALINILYAFFKYPKTCQNSEHTCWFCLATIKELAERVGLKVSHIELVEDYRIDKLPNSREDRPSNKYVFLAKLFFLIKWLLPKRLRGNSILIILSKLK